jgi:hypothetical protein
MNFTEVGLAVRSWTLSELQNRIRVVEASGRALLAISRFTAVTGMSPTTALTFEFTGAVPTQRVTLIAYDGVTLPDLGGKTPICIGQCVIEERDSHVVAAR